MFLQILFVVCLIGTSYARTDVEIKQWFFGIAVQCSTEHPVTTEELQMMYKHKIPEHQNAKCLLACVFKKANWMDSKGMFDIQKAYELTDVEYADDPTKIENSRKVYEICQKVNDEPVSDGESGCERALLLAKCMSEHGRRVWTLFVSQVFTRPYVQLIPYSIHQQARTVTEMKQWFFGLAVKCSKDNPVTMEDLQKMYNHKIPDNQNAKCLLACVYKKSNWMDSKGIFHEEKAYQMTDAEYDDDIKRENSRKVFEICKKVNDEPAGDGESGCDRAFFLTKCILETGLKLGFQI